MIIGIANIIGCKNSSGTSNPPVATSDPVISGTNVVGQTLSCTDGTWTGSLPITFTYQWKRNGLDILGATSSTYVLVQADASNTITCVVTATNIAGSANATSSNSFVILDADAYAFLNASTITDATITTAINVLCVGLKSNNIWTKMKALYPFVGGTASTHKWNLKDPQDTNAAFRLTFHGGITHNSNGMIAAINGYANTYLTPSTALSQNDTHISYYSRTSQANATACEMGCNPVGNAGGSLILVKWSDGLSYYRVNSGTTYITVANSDSKGFYMSNRTASNVINGWKNSTKVATGTIASNGLANVAMLINAYNDGGSIFYYSLKDCAFASVGNGLNDTEAANFYTLIQNFQTTLSRQV
jgi:hypothetical protein